MSRQQPRFTRPDPPFPYTTLFRSEAGERARRVGRACSSRSFSWLDLARGKGETMIDAPADRHPVSALRRHIDGHADDQRSGARHVGGDAAMVAMIDRKSVV